MHHKEVNAHWHAALRRVGIPDDRWHMMPDDRDKARRAMERLFARPADGARQTSGGRDVR